ncbi:MAG: glycine zipper 2TM domain-containing protein [Alphaproteobacteria bacterium]|nr:glycine zipper 2TM domain-containing protein [Alphaproteobacteria bacterium]
MRNSLKAAAIAILMTVSFASPAHADKSFWGGAMGAGLGGLLGSQFGHGDGRLAYTGLGVAMGALAGNGIGESLDRADRMHVSSYYGRTSGFSPNYYYVHPRYEPTYVAPPMHSTRIIYVQQPTYVTGGYVGVSTPQEYCREYTQTVRIGDEIRDSYGTACLQPDGSWRMQ